MLRRQPLTARTGQLSRPSKPTRSRRSVDDVGHWSASLRDRDEPARREQGRHSGRGLAGCGLLEITTTSLTSEDGALLLQESGLEGVDPMEYLANVRSRVEEWVSSIQGGRVAAPQMLANELTAIAQVLLSDLVVPTTSADPRPSSVRTTPLVRRGLSTTWRDVSVRRGAGWLSGCGAGSSSAGRRGPTSCANATPRQARPSHGGSPGSAPRRRRRRPARTPSPRWGRAPTSPRRPHSVGVARPVDRRPRA